MPARGPGDRLFNMLARYYALEDPRSTYEFNWNYQTPSSEVEHGRGGEAEM